MNLFLDTSSLIKLYHKEIGSDELISFFKSNTFNTIYLSELSKLEFLSAFWKKVRICEIEEKKMFTGYKLFWF